jgi:His-Xaa-Ser system protein HxsD
MKNIFMKQGRDNDEKYIKISLNPNAYSLQTIYAASYVFLDKAYILLDQDKRKNNEVYLFSKNGEDLERVAKEFVNELINYGHYFSRVENNASTIKTIMQRVLFSVNPKFAEDAEEQEIQELLKELEKDVPETKKKTKHAFTRTKK